MAKLSLAFDIFANNKASGPLKDVGDQAEKTGKRIEDAGKKGGGFGSSISGAMKAAAGAIAAAGIGRAFVGFVQDAQESAKIARLTEAAIRSTGGAAGITADQIGDLATALSNKSGVDDELIQSSNNVLLTFTKVRNEAGKGNDIFNQGAEAALNMSAALGTDLQGATTMIGKALNDPIAGISAMTRAGVQFTDQQKEQIKTLVESGDTLGAQKIILGELETQFGGAAEAAADPMTRLATIAGNLGEKVGEWLLPHVEKFSTFLTDTAVPAVGQLFGVLKGDGFTEGPFAEDSPVIRGATVLREGFLELVEYVKTEVIPRVIELGTWLRDNKDTLVTVGAVILTVVGAVKAYTTAVAIQAAVTKGIAAVTGAWATVQAVLNGTLALNPIGIVVAALVALGAALFLAYQKSETFRDIVDSAWAKIREAVSVAWEGYIKPAFEAIAGFVTETLIPAITWLWQKVIVPAFQGIAAVIGWAWNYVIQPLFKAWWGYITNVLIPVIQWLWNNVVKPVFESIGSAISTAWESIIKPAFEGLKSIVETLYGHFETARDNVGKFIDKLKGFTLPDWVQKLVDAVKTIAGGIGGAVGRVGEFFGLGDAPASFRGTVLGGGPALARVRSILPAGLSVTSTYRSPEANRRVGGSPTSLHMDRSNPAVDIGGPTGMLDRFAAQLAAMGGWRQLLWRVQGHYDHIHVAHNGGVVSAGWPRMPGDRWDERTARLQVGEVVVPKSAANRDKGGDTYVTVNVDASSLRSVADLEQLLQNARRLSRQKNGVR